MQNALTFGLVLLGPVLALATFSVLGPLDPATSTTWLRVVLLADLVYVLVLATLVLGTVMRMIAARRARSAGARLHLRLAYVFAIIALLPTVTVAVFAGLTVNIGLEGWFSDRVRGVVGASLSAAEAYREDTRADLIEDADALARFLDSARDQDFFVSDGELRQLLTQGQGLIQRGLAEAYVIDGSAEIKARGERSYLFDFEPPERADIADTADGAVVIEDLARGEYRALVPLDRFPNRYLYVSRDVDTRILSLLDDATQTATLYTQLEETRGRVLFEFGLLYLGFAVILILAAIWLGLYFAERLSRPVGRLAAAAQRVGAGDLNVQVREEESDDEIATLGTIFNQMTRQLKGQRDALLETNRQIDRRRRLFDSVLSSVTSGVIGLDADGRISFVNRSAEVILGQEGAEEGRARLEEVVPEFDAVLARLRDGTRETAQEEIKLNREGGIEHLLVRASVRRREDGAPEGFVVAFDDVTDLVTAQRMAAWGDVARRIAHEIKNPLTPIQLSADRIRRRFSKLAGEDAEKVGELTEVIVRQTADLRRIVDEFSKFARMPEPDRRHEDVGDLVRRAVLLQDEAMDGVKVRATLPDRRLPAELDATMIGQALTNLIKNAGEAIETLREKGEAPDGHAGEVRVAVTADGDWATVTVADNGIGLPQDRARLFEPYVTTRDKGTGLGLPIVKKIVEEHGGTLSLRDADPFAEGARPGAEAVMRLPLIAETATDGDPLRGQTEEPRQETARAAE